MFKGFGAPELLIILAIVVVLFGATRLGQLGGSIGRGIKEFRREMKDEPQDEQVNQVHSTEEPSQPLPPREETKTTGSRSTRPQH